MPSLPTGPSTPKLYVPSKGLKSPLPIPINATSHLTSKVHSQHPKKTKTSINTRQFHPEKDAHAQPGEDYDNVNKSYMKIRSVLFPLKQLDFSDRMNKPQNDSFLRFFTLIVILLPSLAATILPLLFPEWSANFDLASLVTDLIMIVSIGLFIKFSIEWPWNWLEQIRTVKKEIIKEVNKHLLGVNSLDETDSHAIESKIMKHLALIKTMKNYEKLAIVTCIGGVLIGTLLMILARTFIVVERSRKDLVFNNFNIILFVLWGLFRSMLSIYDNLQEQSVIKLSDTLDDQTFIDENDIDSLLTHDTDMFKPQPFFNKKRLKMFGFGRDKFDAIQQKSELFNLQNTLQNILLKTTEQYYLLQTLVENQIDEMSKLRSILLSIETGVKSLQETKEKFSTKKELDSITDNDKSDDTKSILLTPFPLHSPKGALKPYSDCLGEVQSSRHYENPVLNIRKNKGSRTMSTIFEESSNCQQGTVAHSPRFEMECGDEISQDSSMSLYQKQNFHEFVDPKPLEMPIGNQAQIKAQNSQTKRSHFSLHGLPFTSVIKELITRKFVHEDELKISLENLEGYDGEMHHAQDFSSVASYHKINARKFKEDSLLNDFFSMLDKLSDKLSGIALHETFANPFAMSQIYYTEILPILKEFSKSCYIRASKNVEFAKNEIWNIFDLYILQNSKNIITVALHIHQSYLVSIKRFIAFYFLIFSKIPINILRFWISVHLFFPKLFIKAFMIYPILSLYHAFNKHTYNSTPHFQQSEQSNFSKMRPFNLSTRQEKVFAPHRYGPLRTRAVFLNQVSKYFNVEANQIPLSGPDRIAPVELRIRK